MLRARTGPQRQRPHTLRSPVIFRFLCKIRPRGHQHARGGCKNKSSVERSAAKPLQEFRAYCHRAAGKQEDRAKETQSSHPPLPRPLLNFCSWSRGRQHARGSCNKKIKCRARGQNQRSTMLTLSSPQTSPNFRVRHHWAAGKREDRAKEAQSSQPPLPRPLRIFVFIVMGSPACERKLQKKSRVE